MTANKKIAAITALLVICTTVAVFAADLTQADKDLLFECRFGSLQEVQDAIDSGANVNVQDSSGETPLIYAAIHNRPQMTEMLIDAGGNVNLANNLDATPLMYAARHADSEVLSMLIDAGANVDDGDFEGSTALMYAAWAQLPEGEIAANITVLLEAGADVTLREHSGRKFNALDYIVENDLVNTVAFDAIWDAAFAAGLTSSDMLQAHNARAERSNFFELCAGRGSASDVRQAIDAGADIHKRDSYGWTPLIYAARYGHFNTLALLLEKGADADIDAVDAQGWSALMYAAHYGNVAALRVLLENGADVTVRGKDGKTALDYARAYDRARIIAILLAADGSSPATATAAASANTATAATESAVPHLAWTDSSGTVIAESHIGDEVFALAKVDASFIPDGTPVTITIFEYNESSGRADDYVTQIRTTVQEGSVSASWVVSYDTEQTGTQCAAELAERGWSLPQYRFRVRYGDYGGHRSELSAPLTAWDALTRPVLISGTDIPLRNRRYTLRLPDGTERTGTTDENGYMHEYRIPIGESRINFDDSDDSED